MQAFQIILGIGILILTFIDFFHTTLSGNGFWIITGRTNGWLSKLIMSKPSKILYKYSGVAHIILSVSVWLLMLLVGVFLIFSSGEDMVVDSNTGAPATLLERFYYTCYTLSTLGLGDLEPGTASSRFLTGILSFTGFILLTIAMTYLLNVISAGLQKKQLACYISSLGQDLESLYSFCHGDKTLSSLQSNSPELRRLILQNASSYGYFPIVHYFRSWNRKYSIEVQLASLYEVLLVLRELVEESTTEASTIESLLRAIAYYLEMGIQQKEKFEVDQQGLALLRAHWGKMGLPYRKEHEMDLAVTASLKSAGWQWEDVYRS